VPILRHRGLHRNEYTGVTLRDHLGLPRPELSEVGLAAGWVDDPTSARVRRCRYTGCIAVAGECMQRIWHRTAAVKDMLQAARTQRYLDKAH
jgi:hypothetical protein